MTGENLEKSEVVPVSKSSMASGPVPKERIEFRGCGRAFFADNLLEVAFVSCEESSFNFMSIADSLPSDVVAEETADSFVASWCLCDENAPCVRGDYLEAVVEVIFILSIIAGRVGFEDSVVVVI